MKVKIGHTIFDSEIEPIMLIMSEQDKRNIKNMSLTCTKFCSFPDGMDIEIIKNFME